MSDRVYLRGDVRCEPLIGAWFAWGGLVPPLQSALYSQERHLPLLRSFVADPVLHARAARDATLRGGAFVNLDELHRGRVQSLVEQAEADEEQRNLVAAVRELQQLVETEADGLDLTRFYARVPAALRGYVELHYDLAHAPGFRVNEPLLYRSSFYRPAQQRLVLEVAESDARPFMMSTPRLAPREGALTLSLPFASPLVDRLFRSRSEPAELRALADELGVREGERSTFDTLFTKAPPRRPTPYLKDGMRVRYFGHACVLLEGGGVSVLTDPNVSYAAGQGMPRYSYEDLPPTIDYVLLSHAHQDHVFLETLLQLRHRVGCLVVPRNLDGMLQDPSLELMLRAIGFPQVRELRDGEELSLPGGSLRALPFLGEHHDLLIGSKLNYAVTLAGTTALFLTDSCNVSPELFSLVAPQVGEVHALFLGMECEGSPPSWVYGPLFSGSIDRAMDQSRRGRGCNAREAEDIVARLRPERVFVYAMGQEPWLSFILDFPMTPDAYPMQQVREFCFQCERRGVSAQYLYGKGEFEL